MTKPFYLQIVVLLIVFSLTNDLSYAQDRILTTHVMVANITPGGLTGNFEEILLEDGLDMSKRALCNTLDTARQNAIYIPGINIHREYGRLTNINFEGTDLSGSDLTETHFENCSFKNCILIGTHFDTSLRTCDFTGAIISPDEPPRYGTLEPRTGGWFGFRADLTKEQLLSTKSYQEKNLYGVFLRGSDLRGVDFSGFDLSRTELSDCLLQDADFSDAIIQGLGLGYSFSRGLSLEQLQSTRTFKDGTFMNFYMYLKNGPEDKEVDFSSKVFVQCTFDARDYSSATKNVDPNVDGNWIVPYYNVNLNLTDSVISQCDFQHFPSLTLENIKSTWNYKHGCMEGIKLPEEIQKALDAEKEQ